MRGATPSSTHRSHGFWRFQSTLPMRGATGTALAATNKEVYFNPHSPCGERRLQSPYGADSDNFNPHSPCGERHLRGTNTRSGELFQSTLPMRGATASQHPFHDLKIDFNPHSPCGERQALTAAKILSQKFQSTLPMRGATAKVTEFTLNLKTKFMTFGTKTNCETLQSSVSRICSNEKNYISQVRISKQFMIASHSHIYKISGSSGIYDALFPKCSTFF